MELFRRGRIALLVSAAVLLVGSGVALVEAKVLHGTRHGDHLVGTNLPDQMTGGRGADSLRGRGSADKLNGGRGADRLNGGKAFDVILGGRGNDRIYARDRHTDRIDCGAGRDKVFVDRLEDGVRNCEKVVQP